MKSINLDEEIPQYAKSDTIEYDDDYGTQYEMPTKRDILRSCIPILEELAKEKTPFHGIMLTRSGMRVGNFIEWLERLVNEKGDTV